MAIRGYRDGRRIDLEDPERNDWNFRSLLRCRANSRDNDIQDQLIKSCGMSTCTSSFIENKLINTFI